HSRSSTPPKAQRTTGRAFSLSIARPVVLFTPGEPCPANPGPHPRGGHRPGGPARPRGVELGAPGRAPRPLEERPVRPLRLQGGPADPGPRRRGGALRGRGGASGPGGAARSTAGRRPV